MPRSEHGHGEQAVTPDVRMVPVAVTACVAAALGISGRPRLILVAAAGWLLASMIAARRKGWLVVVTALVGLSVLVTSGMRDHIVHGMGVAELADEGAMVTVTGRVTVEPRTFDGNGSGGPMVMITLSVSRVAT